MESNLMQQILDYSVPPKQFALWWLGQNGWIIKSPAGFTLAVDPYLSNSAEGRRPNIDFSRRVPIFIAPNEMKVDLVACTHSHIDHADPETLKGCRKAGVSRFLGPAETQLVFADCGIPQTDRILTWPNHVVEFADIRITGTFALPTDGRDLTHMGFVIEVDEGPGLYITGDSGWCELLESAARHRPEVMIVCINAAFENLSHREAAELVKRIDPKIAIPCHYDMFPDNECSPNMFRVSLEIKGIGEKYFHLPHATLFCYGRDKPVGI
jgi:L-ascorbate 6-phosphate lactonase